MAIQLRKPIKIEHAVMPPEVVEFIDGLLEKKLRRMQEAASARYAQRLSAADVTMARTLLRNLRDKDHHDMMINTLLGLPYEEFSIHEYGGDTYMIGLTKPIIMECFHSSTPAGKYNIGKYYVAFSENAFLRGTAEKISLLPKANIRAVQRTPHHWANGENGIHPIAWDPHTCLGSFSPGIVGALQMFNIVEYMRVWHMYLSRANLNSQLRSEGAYGLEGGTLGLMTWKELVQ